MANFLTKDVSRTMFGFCLVRDKRATFQHLGKPSFMPKRVISSTKLKCEGGGGVKVVEGKENKDDEDLKTLYSNDEQLFELVIECVMDKVYMDSLEDRELNRMWWIDLLTWTLVEIFEFRWKHEDGTFDGYPCFTFKNVTQDNDVQATIVVEEKGFTYRVGGEVSAVSLGLSMDSLSLIM
ncbi:Uncharacterized protein Rs2_38205 [Raphanus sativus]|nr:Uncharacterized protein Rs2_38205 [Raphanus sativus]